jgi:hypothetical protein
MNDAESPRGIPCYIDNSKPTIADLAVGARIDDWHPANNAAIKMVCCLEAIRDLAPLFSFLSTLSVPQTGTRFIKSIATPLYSLAIGIRDVYGEIEASKLTGMNKRDRKAFLKRKEDYSSSVFQGKSGPLKTVRDKIGAHIDHDVILAGESVWKHVGLIPFIDIVRLCLMELDFLLHHDIYAWTRKTDHPNLIRLMSVDGTLVDLVEENGEPQYIASVSFVESPRWGIVREVNGFVALVNSVVAAIGRSRTNAVR